MLQRHKEQDMVEQQPDIHEREQEQIKKLRAASKKIKHFLESEEERTEENHYHSRIWLPKPRDAGTP